MRRLLDHLVWATVITATIGALMLGTPSPPLNAQPNPRYMNGPTAEDVIRANGIDPTLFIE